MQLHFKMALAISVAITTSLAGTIPARSANGVPKPDHIVVVLEENHSFDEIMGSSSAPYINGLAQQGALFTQSSAIEHPSQPNYLDLFSGSDQGVTDDKCPQSFTAPNLASELIAAGDTFGGYSEHLPAVGSGVCRTHGYARKHSPWVNFDGTSNGIPAADNMPFEGYFPSDYNKLPTVSFVIPTLMDDMHDGTIGQADTWLEHNIDSYAQWAKTHNSLLIVTFDENDSKEYPAKSSNQIVTIFVGASVKPGQYSTPINHYGLLRTIEDAYGLPYAGSSKSASPITNVWK